MIFYVQIALGLWLMISPWILGYSSISLMRWNSLIIGAFLIILNTWAVLQEGIKENDDSLI